MLNQTNDSWYGPTGASRQHLSHLVFRCVENRMACARTALTGVSGFIEPDGSVHQTIDLFQAGVETRSLPLLKMDTFFTRRGDLAGPGGLAACLVLALVGAFIRRKKDSPDQA